MRILIVEDDEAIAGMLRRGLQDAQYQVDHAADGVTGLEMVWEKATASLCST